MDSPYPVIICRSNKFQIAKFFFSRSEDCYHFLHGEHSSLFEIRSDLREQR